ncbi:MAG: PIG-L deacetylase family protein [Candidatus Thorarchaeota archaeon]
MSLNLITDSETKVLFVSAHPDDVELGAGATVAKCVRLGATVYYVALTNIEDNVVIIDEMKRSIEILGIPNRNCIHFSYTNTGFDKERHEILHELERVRDKFKPNIVFTPSSHDLHQDHYTAAIETLRAFKWSAEILLGYNLSWNIIVEPFNPKLYVEVTKEDASKRISALRCYESQNHRYYMKEQANDAFLRYYGLKAGFEFAEAFEIYKMVWK